MISRPNSTQNHDYLFNIRVEGHSGIGKTSTITSYIDSYFPNNYNQPTISTIGVDFRTTTVNLDNKVMKLLIWDTPGSGRFQPFPGMNYRGCHGVLLMYDITNYSSFQAIENYLEGIRKYAPEYCLTILVGNKVDVEHRRTVSFDEGAQLAEKLGLPFFEISAKTGDGVEAAMNELVALLKKGSEEGNINRKDPKEPTSIEKLKKEYCTESKQSTCL